MFWGLCGTVIPVISCSAKLWLYFPAGNIIKASGVFFGIVEDTASLQKTFKKRESSKLPHPVFNRSFAVKWRFCVPFLALKRSEQAGRNFPVIYLWSLESSAQAFRSQKKRCTGFPVTKKRCTSFPSVKKQCTGFHSTSFSVTSRFSLLADCGPNPQARIRQAD